jgi:hypothetical protein
MSSKLNPGGIKVGDKVQRDKEYRNSDWPFGAKDVRVTAVDGCDIQVEGSDIWWYDGFFTVKRETRPIPDERYDPWKVRSPQYLGPCATPQTIKVMSLEEQLKPLNEQVGGDHYKTMKIQPIEYIVANKLGWCEGNIVKYITRWKQKGGAKDIDKVIHYANLLKQMEGIS